ncbi:MAG: 2,3-bisphosphoglycerate-independent phosphoglycerate mutase [Desulfobacterales bacterium]|nr:2,3-bisphosphoglycerate-independent phosphoglycerate mutase [Desulfobacterales bacterium]
MLMILDGWGIGKNDDGNAVYLSKTPFLEKMRNDYPNTQLMCSGEAVGLPDGIMGNSEVGHLNIGAGRIVYQDLLRIDLSIRNGAFFENKVFNELISNVKEKSSSLHLIGLVSDGGVHSQFSHIIALLDLAERKGVKNVYIHAILDGRDTPPDSGAGFIKNLNDHIQKKHNGKIATICGRYYAMDRDTRWDRTEKAYNLYTKADGVHENDPIIAVQNAYAKKETDEFIKPIVIVDENTKPIATMQDNDGLIFFNFRSDRARQLTRSFTEKDFSFFKREQIPAFCSFVTMTQYDEKFTLPIAFPQFELMEILGEIISKQGFKQLRIAETEKYAHVTYFFNGGIEKPFTLEDRCLIPSPRDIATYDLRPEMSAYKVKDELLNRLNTNNYDLIVVNFANMDMVGHTGIIDAAIKACQAVDNSVKEVATLAKEKGYAVMITADHGNSETMKDENGHPHTAHTLNPVRFILVDDSRKAISLRKGVLGDIAPTILEIMGIDKPEKMTGTSLIEKNN